MIRTKTGLYARRSVTSTSIFTGTEKVLPNEKFDQNHRGGLLPSILTILLIGQSNRMQISIHQPDSCCNNKRWALCGQTLTGCYFATDKSINLRSFSAMDLVENYGGDGKIKKNHEPTNQKRSSKKRRQI